MSIVRIRGGKEPMMGLNQHLEAHRTASRDSPSQMTSRRYQATRPRRSVGEAVGSADLANDVAVYLLTETTIK